MKIINLLLSDKNGGVEQSFVAYCQILKSLNHELLAIIKKNAPYKKDLEKLEIKVIEIENKFGYHDIFAVKNIRKIIKDFDAKLVFAHVGRGISLTKKALKNLKILLIAVNHSNNVKRSIGADIILSVNKEIFYKTVDLGQPADRSFTMPNFINFKSENKEFKIENFDFKNKKIRIGFMGRLAKEKGLEDLIKALKIIENDAELIIAGDGELKEELQNLTKSLNLENKIKFLGWIDDKENFFNQIDIFCLPSLEETFGIVILEAFARHKPVIATNCDGPKTIIRNEINGILIEKNSPKKIAEAVLKLKSNPDLAFDLATNANNVLSKNYSFSATKDRISEIIRHC